MITQILLAAGMLALLFLLFLVLSKSIGSIDNCLYKLEYLIRKECDLKLEGLEKKYKMRAADKKFDELYSIRRVEEDAKKDAEKQRADQQKADGGNV